MPPVDKLTILVYSTSLVQTDKVVQASGLQLLLPMWVVGVNDIPLKNV